MVLLVSVLSKAISWAGSFGVFRSFVLVLPLGLRVSDGFVRMKGGKPPLLTLGRRTVGGEARDFFFT